MYGSYSSAWAQNLISAGLVVNSELTMQLNDTKKLVWNENQLTFNWFDVTDETKITRANQILTTMLLYTPVDWYWDSLDVTVIEPEEEEDVNAGEGIEEDGEVLDEEIEEEEVEEEEVEEEEEDWEEEEVEEETEPEIEEVEVEETEAEVVEVAPVASPKTGNSPIALAVIPVALAAAAVVAKKRG
jgi:DNA repair exonuclease SbcCD nuclease subunit